jgi:hypothetical protein
MALKMTYDPGKLYQDAKRIEKAIVTKMESIGIAFVADARQQPQPSVSRKSVKGGFKEQGPKEPVYEDRTANLRSSIGYFILKDNVVIGGNVEGKATGVQAAKAVVKDLPKKPGYRLVGVAGMNYASAVESLGYNVITSQSIIAIDNLDKQLKALAKKTGKKTDLLRDAQIS